MFLLEATIMHQFHQLNNKMIENFPANKLFSLHQLNIYVKGQIKHFLSRLNVYVASTDKSNQTVFTMLQM